MNDCVHHWRQEAGDIHAPFTCIRCGEVRELVTDFYKLYEARTGRPWGFNDGQSNSSPVALDTIGPLAA